MREKEPETASGGVGGGGGSVAAYVGKGNAIVSMQGASKRTLMPMLLLELVVSGVDLRRRRG